MRFRIAGRLVFLLLVTALIWPASGCTRRFYRHRTDEQVEDVLTEKNVYPAWGIEQWRVYPDPRARFADPFDPDHPPKPCDDPAAQKLSPNPQKPGPEGVGGWEGVGYLQLLANWDAANRAAASEKASDKVSVKPEAPAKGPIPLASASGSSAPPQGVDSCQRSTDKPFLINLEQAVELGTINSREFQDRREDLYLTALPVTLERFAFAAQAFAVGQVAREWAGVGSTAGHQDTWSFTNNVGVSKLFSTGALLLLDFANQTVIDFTRTPHTISESTASLDIIQPLLRGGGKAVTLEPLTIAERSLLYQIRTYARFRKEFFVSIAGGGGGSITGGSFVPSGVVTVSTVSPTAGLGASGLFPGQINAVQTNFNAAQVTPGQAGRLNLQTAIPPSAAGYLGTILQFAQIGIDDENIATLERFIRLFQALKEGGDLSQLQVDQVEQQLLQGRSTRLTDEQDYGNAIDQFKVQLGLPTALPIELDNSPLGPLTQQFRRYEQVFRQYDEATQASSALSNLPANQLRVALRRLVQEAALTRGTQFRRDFPSLWADVERPNADQLTTRRRRLGAERRNLLDRRADLERIGQRLTEADEARLNRIDYEDSVIEFEQNLREYETRPWTNIADPVRQQESRAIRFRVVDNSFDLLLGQARNERLIDLRSTWPPLPRMCVGGADLLKVSEEDAFATSSRTAVSSRFDLMNARGQLTDAWRQIAVFANSLLGTVNVRYHLGENTPIGAAKPFALGGSRYDNRLTVDYSLPLVRQAEQNNYRASLIAFQRQRRAMMEAEDLTVQTVRGEVRQLRVLAENYRIQQRQVELAYLTVENSLDTLRAPPGAGAQASTAAQAAALSQQLLSAQSRVPTAQNAILTVWINYLNSRLQLYRDLELMPLDPRGVWLDDASNLCCDPPAGQPVAGGRPAPPVGAPDAQPLERLPAPREAEPRH